MLKWYVLLYVFILNRRFSFKLNFILGWNSTRFIPGWNSRVNRNFFIPGRVSSRDEISSRLHVNALLIELSSCRKYHRIIGSIYRILKSRKTIYFSRKNLINKAILLNMSSVLWEIPNTAQKMKFSNKNFFSKCDQTRKLRIWSHLLKNSLMEGFIFCAV